MRGCAAPALASRLCDAAGRTGRGRRAVAPPRPTTRATAPGHGRAARPPPPTATDRWAAAALPHSWAGAGAGAAHRCPPAAGGPAATAEPRSRRTHPADDPGGPDL